MVQSLILRQRHLHLAAWVLSVFFGVVTHAAEPLRLRGVLGGTSLENVTVKKSQIVATVGPQSGIVPPQVAWTLEGDLHASGSALLLSPVYSTECVASFGAKAAAMSGFTHVAKLTLNYAPGPDVPWPQRAIDNAILVFVWIVEGRPIRIAPVAVTHLMEPLDRIARMELLMDRADVERGFAAILLWKDGKFIPPKPWFRDAEANQWLIDAHFLSGATQAAPNERLAAARGRDAVTLLHIAAESGLNRAVDQLLAARAKLMAADRYSTTPLQWAARTGRTGVLEQLATAGADLERDNGDGNFSLRNLIRFRHDSAAAVLVAAGARFDRKVNGVSSAALALELGLIETLRAIALKDGLKPLRHELGPRLASAVKAGHVALVVFLLEHGASANHRAGDEPILVTAAAHRNGTALVNVLLRAGAEARAESRDGISALATAARAGGTGAVEALIAAKADPNRVDHAGRTALHFAAAAIDPRITVALLEAGARVATTDQKGVTALDIALSRQARPVAAALLAAGARVELNATAAPRMLVDAIILNLRELVERAAADGWNPTAIAGVSSPPITLARYAGATDVAAWLEKYPVAAGPDIAVVGPDDSPPQAKTFKQPVDLRADDVVYPEAQVMVAGVVEVDGTLSYPIVATRDEELRVATLEAVRTWRFTPAQRSGTPVAVAIKFPVIFPIKDNQIYPLNYVDVPPDVRRTSNLIQQIAEQLATSGLRYVGASMVGFVVEKDGSVRDVTLPENLPEDYGRTLRRMVRDSQFSPGIRRGQPVRTWVEMLVGYDLKVTYVIDERARFDLSPKQ